MAKHLVLLLTAPPEFDARERELQEIENRVSEVARLEKENEELRVELARLREPQAEASNPPTARVVLGALSPNKPTKNYNVTYCKTMAEVDHSDLLREHETLIAKHEELGKTYENVRSKLRERTELLDKWANVADRRLQKIQELRNKLKDCRVAARGSEGNDGSASIRSPSPGPAHPQRPKSEFRTYHPDHLPPSLFTISGHFVAPFSTKRVRSESPLQNGELIAADASVNEPVSVPDISAGDDELPQNTALQNQDRPVTIKSEPSSDGPIFVSTRPVLKRKRERIECEPKRLHKIKSEHGSSSGPEYAGEQHHSSAAESIDYEREVHVPTPRKRKSLSRAFRGGNSAGEILKSDKGRENQRNDLLGFGTPGISHSSTRSDVSVHTAPFSAEVQRNHPKLLWPPQSPSLGNSRSRHVTRLNAGISDLAEDGEHDSELGFGPPVKGRLDILLNPPLTHSLAPAKQRGPVDEDTTPFKDANDSDGGFKLAPRRELPFKHTGADDALKRTPIMRSKTNKTSPYPSVIRQRGPHRPSILREDMPRGRSIAGGSTPLRERTADRLKPEDFKPNPRYNDGLPYVYDEVVRGKEARATLSGCIDINCCGKTFRRFAEVERKSIGSSVTSRAEDIKLLETYLGDEAWQLGTMSREDKEETWLLAKTWELANKFGKHRQRYSRMPTPPGFWSVDFPSTQERAEERRQAEEIRAALVRERYREAMRPNGAWLFRDEELH